MASEHQEKDGLHGGKDTSHRKRDACVYSMKEKMKLFEEKIKEQKEPEETLQLERHSSHKTSRTGQHKYDVLHTRLGQRNKDLGRIANASEHSSTDTHSNSASDVNSTTSCRKAFVDELTLRVDKCYNNENKQGDTPHYALSTSLLPPPIQKRVNLPPELPPKRVAKNPALMIGENALEIYDEEQIEHPPQSREPKRRITTRQTSRKIIDNCDKSYCFEKEGSDEDPALMIGENASEIYDEEQIEHPPQSREPKRRITTRQTSRKIIDNCDKSYCFEKEGSDEDPALMIGENALAIYDEEQIEHPPQSREPKRRITTRQTSRKIIDNCDKSYCFEKEGSDEDKEQIYDTIDDNLNRDGAKDQKEKKTTPVTALKNIFGSLKKTGKKKRTLSKKSNALNTTNTKGDYVIDTPDARNIEECGNYLKERTRHIGNKTIPVSEEKVIELKLKKIEAEYFKSFLEDTLKTKATIGWKDMDNGIIVTVRGFARIVEDVEETLEAIHREEIDIAKLMTSEDDMLIVMTSLKESFGQDYCASFEQTNACKMKFEMRHSVVQHLTNAKSVLPPSSPDTLLFGVTRVILQKGSLSSFKAGCLVNIVGPNKVLDEGVLSKAILKLGGSKFEKLFQASVSVNKGGSVFSTSATGGLKCEQVLHVMLTKHPDDIEQVVLQAMRKVLENFECRSKSIAFPPLGVGRMYGYPPETVAEAMLSALEEFLPFTTIKKAHVVIFNDDEYTFEAFQTVFKTFSTKQAEQKRRLQLAENTKETMVVKFVAGTKTKCEAVLDKFIDVINTTFLYTDSLVVQSQIDDAVFNIAKSHQVQVRKVANGYNLKGFKDNVKKVINETTDVIKQKYLNHSDPRASKDYKQRLQRDSKEFVDYMATEDICVPDYWSVKPGQSLRHILKEDETCHLVDLDEQSLEYISIKDMIYTTWNEILVGQGRDARGLDLLNYTNMEVVNIKRVENLVIFNSYAMKRQQFFASLSRKKLDHFPRVEDLPGSTSDPLTLSCDGGMVLHSINDTNIEVNEVYLFHGTDISNVKTICANGLDCRLAAGKAMFGQGIYASESSTKADQYADPKDNRSANGKTMFLMRMTLGRPYLCSNPNATKYRRAPCTSCYKDDCKDPQHEFFDSVLGENGKLFREFVTYEKSQCYPEYLITYNRI